MTSNANNSIINEILLRAIMAVHEARDHGERITLVWIPPTSATQDCTGSFLRIKENKRGTQ
jgi:hypothetical protein